MLTVALVAIGSALGGVARYTLAHLVDGHARSEFPWGTLIVNISGAFAIGVVLAAVIDAGPSSTMYTLLITGFLGSYTTVSAFSLQTCLLIDQEQRLPAAAYFAGSIAACLLAAGTGMAVAGMSPWR